MLNFIVPLALIAGYAIQAIYELDQRQLRLASAVLLVAVGVATYQSIDLNFVNYDNDNAKYVYVYAHTREALSTRQRGRTDREGKLRRTNGNHDRES